MTKKSWWKLPYVVPALVATAIWAGASTAWYVCGTQQLCGSKKVASTNNTLGDNAEDNTTEKLTSSSTQNQTENDTDSVAIIPLPAMQKILFYPDSTEAISVAGLSEPIAYMKANPKASASLAGYYANIPNDTDGAKLSNDRALAIKQYMVQAGIDPQRITTSAKGADATINSSDSASLENARRVEVTVSQ